MLPRVRVRLVDVPVGLFRAAEQHASDLLREVALVAAARDLGPGHVFTDLLAAADAADGAAHQPADVHSRLAESVRVAQRHGWDRVTVDLDVAPDAADHALLWEELLQRFDVLSRAERLLTLPADDELAAYRAWYVTELVEQVRTGRHPESWDAARPAALAGVAG